MQFFGWERQMDAEKNNTHSSMNEADQQHFTYFSRS